MSRVSIINHIGHLYGDRSIALSRADSGKLGIAVDGKAAGWNGSKVDDCSIRKELAHEYDGCATCAWASGWIDGSDGLTWSCHVLYSPLKTIVFMLGGVPNT
jgi:hypothetical protein